MKLIQLPNDSNDRQQKGDSNTDMQQKSDPTCNLADFSASEVLDNYKYVLTSFGLDPKDNELDLPYIYWIPKMHENPY